jgi:hypothetical protein
VRFSRNARIALKRIGLTLFSATLCAHAIAAPQTGLKAKDPAIRNFIESNYGVWVASDKGWRLDGDIYVYQVCDVARLSTADGPRYLLAMCGDEVDTGTGGTPGIASDATGGQTDLYVLKPASNGKGLEPVLKQTGITSGSNGNAAKVSIQQLGPHLYGFVMEDGFVLQGYAETLRSIWLPRPDKLVLAAKHINVSKSNSGTSECAAKARTCEDMEFDITPDTTSTSEVYPLKVHETGSRGNKTIDANYVIHFDTEKNTYIVPAAVSAGY